MDEATRSTTLWPSRNACRHQQVRGRQLGAAAAPVRRSLYVCQHSKLVPIGGQNRPPPNRPVPVVTVIGERRALRNEYLPANRLIRQGCTGKVASNHIRTTFGAAPTGAGTADRADRTYGLQAEISAQERPTHWPAGEGRGGSYRAHRGETAGAGQTCRHLGSAGSARGSLTALWSGWRLARL